MNNRQRDRLTDFILTFLEEIEIDEGKSPLTDFQRKAQRALAWKMAKAAAVVHDYTQSDDAAALTFLSAVKWLRAIANETPSSNATVDSDVLTNNARILLTAFPSDDKTS